MPLSGAYFGAIVGGLVGALLQGTVFGQTSSAGYHAPDGEFISKSGAVQEKAIFIGVTSLAGYITGPWMVSTFSSDPLLGGLLVLGALYFNLHEEIDSWNSSL